MPQLTAVKTATHAPAASPTIRGAFLRLTYGAFATLGVWSWVTPSYATPQVNVGITPGIGWRPHSKVAFDGHVSAEVLFARTGDRSWGVGPRLEVGTRAFDDLHTAAGLSVQLPSDPLAIVISGYALGRTTSHSFDPGVGSRLFLGLRPYNHYGWYAAGLGLTAAVDHVFAHATTNVSLGVQLDGMWLSLPLLAFYQWLAH